MKGAKQDMLFAVINNSREGLSWVIDNLEEDSEVSISEIRSVQCKLQSAIGMLKDLKKDDRFKNSNWWAF